MLGGLVLAGFATVVTEIAKMRRGASPLFEPLRQFHVTRSNSAHRFSGVLV